MKIIKVIDKWLLQVLGLMDFYKLLELIHNEKTELEALRRNNEPKIHYLKEELLKYKNRCDNLERENRAILKMKIGDAKVF